MILMAKKALDNIFSNPVPNNLICLGIFTRVFIIHKIEEEFKKIEAQI